MKKHFFIIGAFLFIGGCVSNTPKPSPEEIQQQIDSTLNVYDDNRVVLKTIRKDKSCRTNTLWSWVSKKDVVLGIRIGNGIYNAKDIYKITSEDSGKSSTNQRVTVFLKNGDKKTVAAGLGASKYFGPSWVVCDKNKNCGNDFVISHSNPNNSFGNALSAIEEKYLLAPSKLLDGNPSNSISNDYRAVPTSPDIQEIAFLDGNEIEKLNSRLLDMTERWDTYYKQREIRIAEKEKEERAKLLNFRKSLKVGSETFCGPVVEVRYPMYKIASRVLLPGYPAEVWLGENDVFGPERGCLNNGGKLTPKPEPSRYGEYSLLSRMLCDPGSWNLPSMFKEKN